MKKILYSVALAACCMGTMTSCSDFLDASNKSNVTAKQSFATKEGLNNLVNDAYQHLQNVYAAPLFTSCFSAGTDMYADARNKMNEALNTYETLTPENTDIKNLYTYLYSGIRAANSVSYYAQTAQVDDKTKGQLIGEARVLAAYEYYLLVNNFGGVPIMKDFLTTADTGYPKSSPEDVYAYIISELEDVISKNVLQASTATKGGGRISQETAKAILAKTYLSAAWDLNKQEYFSKAAALADEVIAGRKLTTKSSFGMWNMIWLQPTIQHQVVQNGAVTTATIWVETRITSRLQPPAMYQPSMPCIVSRRETSVTMLPS